ncbi:hypothetical protein [Caulobacter sp. 17J80-11]|uniref:hypothetical protein n=1 Tax=Caulobacter sp. 17J80-11 TaxID=2763502 RepID=UPI00165367F8|nr:hypothetical protein [Caulobacter sp. 17J80-11]MBC6982252.1 hypothetical protein [Caulobacter sp. 17J80-11]
MKGGEGGVQVRGRHDKSMLKLSSMAFAVGVAALVAGRAEACIVSEAVELMLHDDVSAATSDEELVLRVEITRFPSEEELRSNVPHVISVDAKNVEIDSASVPVPREQLELLIYPRYVWAEVKAVERGHFSDRVVRVRYLDSSCGPFPAVGDRGLLIGHFEVQPDGQPAFVPRMETEGDRKLRKGQPDR